MHGHHGFRSTDLHLPQLFSPLQHQFGEPPKTQQASPHPRDELSAGLLAWS